jgi:hypothetical protein
MENTEQVAIKFHISNSNPTATLGIRVWLDTQAVYENSHVPQDIDFEHNISDADGEHELAIELFGKFPEHTKIDSDGNILEDAMLTINDITIDGIDFSQLFKERSEYHHNFNGTKENTVEKFYGNMGCNGQVRLKFSTPVYIWLLENM